MGRPKGSKNRPKTNGEAPDDAAAPEQAATLPADDGLDIPEALRRVQ